MRKILFAIAGALSLIILVVVAIALTKPARFQVERKVAIAAPAAAVFANLDDFHRWAAWSPWEKLDPQMTKNFSGPDHGTGAVYEWKGNKDVGQGRMTIVDSRPNDLVNIRLQFLEPFPADNRAIFTLKPSGEGTEVSWAMDGPNSFMGKVISVFADMDRMIGGDFERGLANLKQVSEAGARK